MMAKLTFQWNPVPKLTSGAEIHRLVPKLFRTEVTRAEHRLPHLTAKNIIHQFSDVKKHARFILETSLNISITLL